MVDCWGTPAPRALDVLRRRAPVERDAAVPEREPRVVPDHEVVQESDVREPPRCERFRGEVQVLRGRRWITPNEIGGKTKVLRRTGERARS